MQTAIDFVARCLGGSALAALGGMKFKQLTYEEYETLETKDPSTFYIVTKGNKIIVYVGGSSITSFSQAGYVTLVTPGTFAITGDAEISNIGGE